MEPMVRREAEVTEGGKILEENRGWDGDDG